MAFKDGLSFTGNCSQVTAKNKTRKILVRARPSRIMERHSFETKPQIIEITTSIRPDICWGNGIFVNSIATKIQIRVAVISVELGKNMKTSARVRIQISKKINEDRVRSDIIFTAII